uniref:Uncharacterized protein n=1 Tax=Anopheles coluzzii TaxID=1518534 RepID=A0A8W7PFY1_ANOCL
MSLSNTTTIDAELCDGEKLYIIQHTAQSSVSTIQMHVHEHGEAADNVELVNVPSLHAPLNRIVHRLHLFPVAYFQQISTDELNIGELGTAPIAQLLIDIQPNGTHSRRSFAHLLHDLTHLCRELAGITAHIQQALSSSAALVPLTACSCCRLRYS